MKKDFEVKKATVEELLEYIDDYNYFTEPDLWYLKSEYEIETEYDDNGRWSSSAYTIIQLGERFFGIYWEEGLTEMQEDYMSCTELEEIKKIKEVVEVERWVLV